jgi:hypothetical protein
MQTPETNAQATELIFTALDNPSLAINSDVPNTTISMAPNVSNDM